MSLSFPCNGRSPSIIQILAHLGESQMAGPWDTHSFLAVVLRPASLMMKLFQVAQRLNRQTPLLISPSYAYSRPLIFFNSIPVLLNIHLYHQCLAHTGHIGELQTVCHKLCRTKQFQIYITELMITFRSMIFLAVSTIYTFLDTYIYFSFYYTDNT